jgi:hypothetical protein
MSDIMNNQTLNSLMIDRLGSDEGREKVAAAGADFVRMKLREESFMRKILMPEVVTPDECQRSLNTDSLVKIVDKEPDSKAMALSLRGLPDAHYVEGPRYEIPFLQIGGEQFQKTEIELLAYEMPLMDVIEKNNVLDIQKIEDQIFMDHIEAILGDDGSGPYTPTQVVSGLTYSSTTGFKKSHFVELFNLLDGNELQADCLLMNNKMYNKLIQFDATDFGDELGGETFLNGYTYQKLFGRKLIVTNKKRWNSVTINGTSYAEGSDLVPDNMVYAFAPKQFLGNAYVLGDTQFYVDKKRNLITMEAWEHIGMGIGNTSAVAKIVIDGGTDA